MNSDKTKIIIFDRDRMEKVLASNSILLPSGLTREEKRNFILDSAGEKENGKG